MIKAIISDFSRTLLFPKDVDYQGKLNDLYKNEKVKSDFKFFDYFLWNQELGDFYQSLSQNLSIYIFTTENIQNDPSLEPYLSWVKNIFNLSDINCLAKNNPVAYSKLAELIGLPVNSILFVDDSEENIQAAKSAGMQTIKYIDPQDFVERFRLLTE